MRQLSLLLLTCLLLRGQDVVRQSLPEITNYLALTEEQRDQIDAQNADFSQWQLSKYHRIFEVSTEIDQETGKSPLNPPALGVRYAELEAIHRQFDERTAQAAAANLAVLTDEQRSKMAVLTTGIRLLPIAVQAQRAGLIPQNSVSCTYGESPYHMDCAPPGLTQQPDLWIAEQLRDHLSLSGSQVDAVLKNNLDLREWMTEKNKRIWQVQDLIAKATAASPLDPAALGISYVELEVIRREIADRLQQGITANLDLLNESQRAKLKPMEEAIQHKPVSDEAWSLSLVTPPCVSILNATTTRAWFTYPCLLPVQEIRGGIFGLSNPLP